ncbi:MAG: DEAD/DEAH box helicase [Planctomycetota bacterium]
MSRRNRSSRVPRVPANRSEFQAFLEALERRTRQVSPGGDEDDERVIQWSRAIESLCDAHPVNHQRLGEKLRGSAEICNVDPECGCEIILKAGAATHRVSIIIDFHKHTFAALSNCGHHDLCEHTFFVAQKLEAMLDDPKSELVARILGRDPIEKELQKTFSLLQSLARNAQLEQSRLTDVSVETEKPLQRFVWDLSCDNFGDYVLRPCLQQEKKTGGWTKGREYALEAFLDSAQEHWSIIDRQVAELIHPERWSGMKLNSAEAMKLLVGSDQFTHNREPFRLSMQPLEIIVTEAEGGLRLSTNASDLVREQPGRNVLVDMSRGVVVLQPVSMEAVLFSGPIHSFDICSRLSNKAAVIPSEKKNELLKQIELLRQNMSVRLPESIAGTQVSYKASSVLLLQLRRNGMMDASVQMKDRNGLLHLPGEGLATIAVMTDGRKTQYIRDLSYETSAATGLAKALRLHHGIPLSRWSWRIADGEHISNLLTETGDYVERGELSVLWHKDSVSRFDIIGRLTANNVRVEVSRQRDWFGLNGACRIGDHEIPLKEILSGISGRSTNGLTEISPGKWASVADELREALRHLADVATENRGKLQLDASAAPAVSALGQARIQIAADQHWDKCLNRLREATDMTFDPPAGLNCELRDYQRDGFRWLARLSHWGIGGILADDMGLGKTVQTLALLLTRVESGPTLVIAPTSLGFNWQRECERLTPSLRPILFRDSDRLDLKNYLGEGDLVICSYGLALREAEVLKEIRWGTMILDEAQNIKNSNSKTAAQIRTFQADWKIALTGTPMENHLGELWSIFHTIAPGVLGSWEQFRRRFAAPIEKDGNADRREGLSRVIAPFILRRKKSDVLKDLPERTESNLMVDLSADERLRYDQMRLAAVTELDSIGDENLSHDQRFRVLQMLTRLRQMSCHIGLVDDKWKGSSSKLHVLMECLDQLKEQGNRPLIFSQFTTHLGLIREALDKAGITYQYLDGQTTPVQRQQRVDAFQNGEGDAFLISLKAGGTGLNLTAADYVIHMDPWWNPAVEDQATDRAHRIGQTRSVMVYRIIARGTVEEQILKMHDDKRDLVESVLSGTDASARLSTRELAELIRSGVEVPLKP